MDNINIHVDSSLTDILLFVASKNSDMESQYLQV